MSREPVPAPPPYDDSFAAIRGRIREDIAIVARIEGVPADLKLVLRLCLVTPGFQFVLSRRIQEAVRRIPVVGPAIRRVLWSLTCVVYGSELAPSAEIGGGLYVPHPFGIVVGRSHVGRGVALMQGVTIGNLHVADRSAPVIGDGCSLGAGCAVLGPVRLGAGARVGANAVVLVDVPAGGTAVGIPARVLGRADP
ncbi:hypothetical protein [Aureimonas sp. SK2]|uniref:serine O-acetyltransferase n=1 Tax=Aureimonas sp. SK2 TaxID=3015992 RepID=UPI0024438D48|nr:hypothetical protein [Aureimonas sp. SK2]